jgi:hypothetical protein
VTHPSSSLTRSSSSDLHGQLPKLLLAAASLDFADSLCLGRKDLIASESHETRYAFGQYVTRLSLFAPQLRPVGKIAQSQLEFSGRCMVRGRVLAESLTDFTPPGDLKPLKDRQADCTSDYRCRGPMYSLVDRN